MRGAKPIACITLSASSVLDSPPLAGDTVTLTLSPESSMVSTLVPVSTVTPSFLYCLASSAETSGSSSGTIRSRYSTMVTWVP